MNDLLLNEELERLKLNALAEFAAGAGHEINNPLAIISGHAQLLLKKADDPNERRHLSMIISQVNRAYEMIADIRLFARPPQPQWSFFCLNDLLQTFIEKMNEKWKTVLFSIDVIKGEEKISEETGKIESSISIQSDFALLMTVLTALGNNAAEAISQDGSVLVSALIEQNRKSSENVVSPSMKSIKLEKTNRSNQPESFAYRNIEFVQIVLEDNGPGISEEIREHIFSPYFSGRSFGRGLGFGLSKSWRFVQQLGGRLFLTSPTHFSQGCRWVIELPVRPLNDIISLHKTNLNSQTE